MLNGGGRSLEDMRMLRGDAGLQRLLGVGVDIPGSDATGDWLRRVGASGGLRRVGLGAQTFFREGNKAPVSRNLEFLKACEANMPKGKRMAFLRADAATVMDWHCQRGEYSENHIKGLKLVFGMERMPCGRFEAIAVFFRIRALAYSLFVMFKTHALPKEWRKHQVRTMRWRLYQIAGRITCHARSLWLNVSGAHTVFRNIRRRRVLLAFT
ncbi:hypothetical protein D6833_06195 [Candidatus Parcubacteria bacterium]|nr:MAG: hypothetical protein D6833_06195 [Candidatus Parcubacteria bacterium]